MGFFLGALAVGGFIVAILLSDSSGEEKANTILYGIGKVIFILVVVPLMTAIFMAVCGGM